MTRSSAQCPPTAAHRVCCRCPLPAWVLEHRELTKLTTTFLEPYATRAVAVASDSAATAAADVASASASATTLARLHTCWHATATGTGRLSSRYPNVQQVPKHVTTLTSADAPPEAGTAASTVSVRSAFRAPPASMLIAADYRQVSSQSLPRADF